MESDIFESALEKLQAGRSVRFDYTDSNAEATERIVNALIEFGARVTCEDPWGEPGWVEMEMRKSAPANGR